MPRQRVHFQVFWGVFFYMLDFSKKKRLSFHQITPVVNCDKRIQFSKKNQSSNNTVASAKNQIGSRLAEKRRKHDSSLCLKFQVHLGKCSHNECMIAWRVLKLPALFLNVKFDLSIQFHLRSRIPFSTASSIILVYVTHCILS